MASMQEIRAYIAKWIGPTAHPPKHLSTSQLQYLWSLGDGFGKFRNWDDLQDATHNSGYDWSHIRDSSDTALLRISDKLEQFTGDILDPEKYKKPTGFDEGPITAQLAVKALRNGMEALEAHKIIYVIVSFNGQGRPGNPTDFTAGSVCGNLTRMSAWLEQFSKSWTFWTFKVTDMTTDRNAAREMAEEI